MRVLASKMGFLDGMRRLKGQVFEVPEGATGKWFAPVVSSGSQVLTKPEKAVGKAAKGVKTPRANEPETFSAITKQDVADATVKGVDDLL